MGRNGAEWNLGDEGRGIWMTGRGVGEIEGERASAWNGMNWYDRWNGGIFIHCTSVSGTDEWNTAAAMFFKASSTEKFAHL